MSQPLTASVQGTELLRPLIAQWEVSVAMLLERLDGLTDDEYRWRPTPNSADLVDAGAGNLVVQLHPEPTSTRTIAWTLGHLADMCWARADYTDGEKNRPPDYQPFPATADAALEDFRGAAARWLSAVVTASAAQAVQVGYSSWPHGWDRNLPFVDIVWWMNRELIAHGSDASTVRDLYAAQARAPTG